MMRKHIHIAVVFCVFLFWNSYALRAQTAIIEDFKGTPRVNRFDTRSLSMGGATLSDVGAGASLGINPALSGFSGINKSFTLDSYQNWDTNLLQLDISTPALSIKQNHFTLQLGYSQTGLNSVNFLGASTAPEPDLMMFQSNLGYAYMVDRDFSLGVVQTVTYGTNDIAHYWTYAANLGLVYAPDGPVSYGMVLRGLGRSLDYTIIETGATTLGSSLAQTSLEIGATLRYPVEMEKTYITLTFANEKRFGERGVWYKGGLEILPIPYVALRGGVLFNISQVVYIPRFGIGININTLQLHYMVAPNNRPGEHFQQLGLTIQL